MFEASNFSVCNASEQTYYNKSHLIFCDFVDFIPTYYGQGYFFSLILWTETVDTIIRVIDRPEFGYLVLQILLSESSTARDLVTSNYTCHYLDYPDGLIWAATCARRTIQKVSSDTNRKILRENLNSNIKRNILVQTFPLY